MTLAAFLTVAFLHLMAAISPGPAVLMSARTGVTDGLRTGTYLAAGIGVGGVIWAAAALFGLAIVFEAAPALLWALKIAGGAYLIYTGVMLWRTADQPLDMDKPPPRAAPPRRFALASSLNLPTPNPPCCFRPFSSAPSPPAPRFG